jgi:glucosamine--fructose-6-phosphate aminotransferase (isomerizing)
MCGIIGIVSRSDVESYLIDGLKRLEYRGYDSAGIATIHDNEIDRRRSAGKLFHLQKLLQSEPIQGQIGIGHTRWATHGAANTENAHPHSSREVAVVHNGIIENFSDLKRQLQEKGYSFQSDTDTEVIVYLITDYLHQGNNPFNSVQKTLAQLQGAFALAILFKDDPNTLIATRQGSPLVLGVKENELFVSSDAVAFAPWTQQVCYLEEGDLAVLRKGNHFTYKIYDRNGFEVERPLRRSQITGESVSKAEYSHYMLKEILEQPTVLSDTLQSLLNLEDQKVSLKDIDLDWNTFDRIRIIACGTSYYAGLVAKYWFEKWAGIAVDVEIASEFRYRCPVLSANTLSILISQSGETIDTLAVLSMLKERGHQVLALVNVPESSIARKADYVLQTLAGPEIGVASTKAFTSQLMVLACLSLKVGRERGSIKPDVYKSLVSALISLPGMIGYVLQNPEVYQKLALSFTTARNCLYLGRGITYPIALEGALKLKEISYIHAEGYAAGELKHGPIALVDVTMPVVVLAPHDEWFEKTLSNLQEVMARGAQLLCLTDQKGAEKIKQQVKSTYPVEIVVFPHVDAFIEPILYTIPIQLLAYYIALLKGTDIDQPRNLAKSVTVE